MESWRRVWREGFAPQFDLDQLLVLEKVLADEDVRLIQGHTTCPPPLQCVADWPCEGACFIGMAGWQLDTDMVVGEVEEFFAKACFNCDQLLGEPAACRHLINFYDEAPIPEARAALLPEVRLAIQQLHDREGTNGST